MFNLTVEDASKRLGVGRARVNQLIRSGMLAAEKVGGIWLIDEQSVEARRNAAPKAGRPPASSSKGDVGRYVLMNRTHEVLSFRYDEAAGAFVDAGDIVDPARAPLGMISPEVEKSRKTRCRSGGSIAASPELEKASTRSWPSWASIHLRGFPSRALGCLCRISIGFVPKTVKSPGRT